MLKKVCVNVVWCVAFLLVSGLLGNSGASADQGGVDSYTKLMLHADGSDQGTSFTDSSSGAKTVTNTETYDSYTKLMLHIENNVTDSAAGKTVTNNNATFSSSVYKMGGYSGVFNGSNAYLSLADSDDWNFGSGDFTIDFWVRPAATINSADHIVGQYADVNNYWILDIHESAGIEFYARSGGVNVFSSSPYGGTLSANTWYHIAIVRHGNVFTIYKDGVSVGITTESVTMPNIVSNLYIGSQGTTNYWDGYLDELRISKGIARWTSNFTPPSSPYGKVATVTSQKKFGTASGEFHGSVDYLSLADSDDWNFGSGDYTIDCWVRLNTSGIQWQPICSQRTNSNYLATLHIRNDDKIYFNLWNGSYQVNINSTTVLSTGSWYHIALVHTGTTYILFINGVDEASTSNTYNWQDYTGTFDIGHETDFNNAEKYFNGWLDELRISKGIARWTSNFTPPSAPYDVDTTPPTVGTTSPASSATGVGVSTAISATFSEDMDSSTITTTTVTLTSSGSSGNSIRQAQDRSVGWVKRSAPNETEDDEDGFWKANPPPDPLRRGSVDGFASLNPSYTTSPIRQAQDRLNPSYTQSTFTPTSSSVSGTVSYSNKVATFTPSSNLSYSTTYTATITTGVKDAGGNAMSSNYTWSFTTGSAPDTTAPSGSVSINSGASYTNSTSVTLTLSATDSVGVVGYYASTSSSTPVASASGWNSVTSATSYSGSVSYTLASGDEQKTVYVWFKDSAGNVSVSANDSIILDTTAPIVTITSPTSSDTNTATSSTLALEGSASDATSGVKEVTWGSDKGSSGTASGTTYWSISSVSLSTGDNKITVTAKDNAGNTSTDTITVTYSAAKAPTVTTGSTSNVTATQATLTGTVNANGLSTTAWFEYGTVQGTYGSKSSTQTVTGSNDTTVSTTITGLTAETTYYYRIAAQNSAGTSYGSEMSFQYSSKGSAPTVTTESATDVTTTTATLNGKVNANGISTTAWFEYGAQSGSYGSKSNTKSVTGSTDTTVSISISGLTAGTTYYYRIAAQNSVGTSYGTEMSFYYSSEKKAPTVETDAATNVTATSATLNGKCNPNGLSTTAWFEYGTLQGTYDYKTDTQSMSGSSYTSVSAAITKLTAGTTYYYRIAAKNSVGTSYGTEMEFYKSPGGTDTTPTPTATPQPTLTPIPTQTGTPVEGKGLVYGYVEDVDGNALEGVTVTIVGANGGSSSENSTETDENGYYEFSGLSKGNYNLTYEKDGYQTKTKSITLGEGEEKDIETTVLEDEGALGKIYGYVVDIKGNPIESVRLKLKGLKTGAKGMEASDGDGFFEFADLGADTYILTVQKKRYRKSKQTITLEEGESREIEIELRKTSKRIKGLLLEEDIQ